MTRTLLSSALCAWLLALAGAASAQTPFVPAQGYFLGPGTTNGVIVDAGFQNFLIDSDGDGMIEPGEASHPLPQAFTQTVAASQYRLSPTREHLVLFGTAINGVCSGQLSYYVYRIPAVSGDPLELAGPPICVDTSEAFVGFFDPAGSNDRDLFFVVETSDLAMEQQIWFKRLFDGTTSAGSFPLDASVGDVTFAPDGVAAFVQYDVDGIDNLDSYQMFELCFDGLGDFVAPAQGSVFDVSGGGVATARQLSSTTADVIRASDQQQIAQYTLDDCTGPLPDTGACCLPDGSCSPGTTEATCIGAGGTWQGANTACGSVNCPPPPSVEFSLSASGPASAQAPGPITYTLDWRNDGDLPADGVTITARVPNNASFVSASGTGVFTAANQNIVWTLGSITAQSSGQETFVVDVACGVSQVDLVQYFIRSTSPFLVVFGVPSVSTAVTTGGGGPLDVTTTSTSDTGNPPADGDTITHVVTMVETSGVARPGARFGFSVGSVWQYDATVDDAGGSIVVQNNRLDWMGNVAANDTTRVVFRSRVPDCRRFFQSQDALNAGFPFTVFDACNAPIGTAAADTVVLAPLPIDGTVTLFGTGPVANDGFFGDAALVRYGETIEVEVSVSNPSTRALPTANVRFTVPTGLVPVGSPPWVGTPPAGAVWDAGTATATWSGGLAPGAVATLRLALEWPATGPCEAFFRTDYGYGSCVNAGSNSIRVYALPDPITSPHVISVTAFEGLWSYTPSVDTQQQSWFCESFEITGGIARGADGDVWVAGTPTFRIDPVTLELEFYGDLVSNRLDMYQASVVAVDPDTGVVYFGGRRREPGPMSFARVASWDPATDQVTILLDDTVNNRVHIDTRDIDVLADGRVVVATSAGVVILDPAVPGSETILTDPNWPTGVRASGVAGMPDGSVLTTDDLFFFSDPKAMRVFDPDTGVVTPFVANMLDVFPLGLVMYAVDVADNGDAWLAFGSVAQITPDPNPSAVEIAFGGQGTDLDVAWFPGAVVTSVDDDTVEPGAPRILTLHDPTPNPFNPRTTFAFDLPRATTVRMVLFDVRGRLVRTLVEGERDAGAHRVVWDGTDEQGRAVSSGVYFVRWEGDGRRFVKKAVLLR